MEEPLKQKGFFAKYWKLLGAVLLVVCIVTLGIAVYPLVKGNPQVLEITFSTDKPAYGETFMARVVVENNGLLFATFRGVLLVDGAEAGTNDVLLTSKDQQTLLFELKGFSAGRHKASISGKETEFIVYKPAKYEVSGFTVEPEKPMVGETVKVKAKVKNTGDLDGQFYSPLTLDDEEMQAFTTDLQPGAESQFEAEFTIKARGTHTISLEGEKLTVSVIAPAKIAETGLKLSKSFAKPKEAVTATVTVQNTGDLPGKYTVKLLINGNVAQKKDVTVKAKSTLDVAFKVAQPKAGRYAVKAGSLSKSLQVVIIKRLANGNYLARKIKNGQNKMVIKNNYDKDVIVSLTKSSSPKVKQISIYVRAKGKATIKGLPNGDYCLFCSLGKDYDTASKKFITGVEYLKADTVYEFHPKKNYYLQITVTMNVADGTTTVSDVSEADFPQ